jgi:hypothetical protein
MGSMVQARIRGENVARAATNRSRAATAANVAGSEVLSSGTKNILSGLVAMKLTAMPSSTPVPVRNRVWPSTIQVTFWCVAPKAKRNPISRVLRLTVNRMRP